jgi:hypothetical protein
MRENTEKQAGGKDYQKSRALSGKKHYVCALCEEKYELTDDQHKKITCCGYPVNKTEETIFSSPEPFGP